MGAIRLVLACTLTAILTAVITGYYFKQQPGKAAKQVEPTAASPSSSSPSESKPREIRQTASPPSLDFGQTGEFPNTVVVPVALLNTLRIDLFDAGGGISKLFVAVAGLSESQATRLNAELGKVEADLDQFAQKRTTLKMDGSGSATVAVSSFPAEGLGIKKRLLDKITASTNPEIAPYLRDTISSQLDRKYGYFGQYPQEYKISKATDPAFLGRYIVVQRFLLESNKTHATSFYTDRPTVIGKFPQLPSQF